MSVLETRRVYSVYKDALGNPQGGKKIEIELVEDVFADGLTIPQDEYVIYTSTEAGHIGEYEAILYTVTGSHLNYKLILPNKAKTKHKFAVAPGNAVEIDVLINAENVPETLPFSVQLVIAIYGLIAASAVRYDTAQNLTEPQKTQGKANLALQNVNNTSDVNKPVSTAQAAADIAARDAAISMLRAGVAVAGDNLLKLNARLSAQEAIVGGTTPDGDDVINRVQELLTVFQGFSESVNLLTELNNKATVAQFDNLSGEVANTVHLNVDTTPLTFKKLIRANEDGDAIDSNIEDDSDTGTIRFNDKKISRFSSDIKSVENNPDLNVNGYIFQPEDNGKILEFNYAPTDLFFYEGTVIVSVLGEDTPIEFPILPDGFNCTVVLLVNADPTFSSNTLNIKSKRGKIQCDGRETVVAIYKNAGNLRLVGDLK